jgi:hypothetical protein
MHATVPRNTDLGGPMVIICAPKQFHEAPYDGRAVRNQNTIKNATGRQLWAFYLGFVQMWSDTFH